MIMENKNNLLNQDSTLTWCSVEKDHLGSNRVVREETSGINRLQINHYYPFGNTFGEYNHCDENAGLQRYKFNGKELDLVHGMRLYDYGARMYDQILGCWTSVDPMAEKYYHISPYVFCADNPINLIDTDGERIRTILFQDQNAPIWYRSTTSFKKAMFYFAKIKFGQQIFADFTPKGSSFFGIKGNGKYSHYNLTLYEISDSNPQSRTTYFKGNNAQTRMKKNKYGDPEFEIIFDTERIVEGLVETIAHELAGHLSKYPEILDAFKKNGNYKDAKTIWDANSQEEDHEAMKDFKEIATSYYPDFDTRDYPKGRFDESCMDAVPLSFYLLSQATSFEDVIRLAISPGCDSDTIGIIVGSISEARFSIPQEIKNKVMGYLTEDMKQVFKQFDDAHKS